jgi:subtilisin family serine protease
MQFRSTSPNQFWFDIYAPTGEFAVTIPPVPNRTLVYQYQDTTLVVDNCLLEPQTNTQFMVFRIRNPVAGIWRLYAYSKTESLPMQFHLWLPIQDFISKSTFFYRADNYTTITAPGNQLRLICITAYNPADKTLYYYASKGFTINNEPKPDLTAPGVDILSPTANSQFAPSTGTSISAAYMAGVTALVLEWGIVRGYYTRMNTATVKRLLIQGADRDPSITYPSPDWGYGILNITKVINSLTMFLQNTPSPSPYLT